MPCQRGLNSIEPAGKFGVCLAQRLFRIYIKVSGQICHDEQQIAHFVDHILVIQPVAGLDQFGGLLFDLVDDVAGVGPVKPNARRTFLQLERARKGRQVHCDAVQRAALSLACTFGGLDGFPVSGLLLRRFIAVFIPKNMRVPRHHLVGDRGHHGLKGKMPRFLADGRMIDGL